jgi:hypothetical protein
MNIRNVALAVVLLDTLAWAAAAFAYFFSGSDPATKGLDTGAGIVVTALFLITAVPSLILSLLRIAPKAALALALGFPAIFAVLFAAVAIYFIA